MDAAHVTLLNISATKGWFDHYTVPENAVVSLNTAILNKVMTMKKPDHGIIIDLDSSDPDKMTITFIATASSPIVVTGDEAVAATTKTTASPPLYFTFPLIDADQEWMEVPPADASGEAIISSDLFYSTIANSAVFGDAAEFKCTDQSVTVTAEGLEGTLITALDDDVFEEYAVDEGFIMNQTFSVLYLKMIAKFVKFSEMIKLSFTQDQPLVVSATDSRANSDVSLDADVFTVAMYLAPKIDFDDE
jgi:hypothetical protein